MEAFTAGVSVVASSYENSIKFHRQVSGGDGPIVSQRFQLLGNLKLFDSGRSNRGSQITRKGSTIKGGGSGI